MNIAERVKNYYETNDFKDNYAYCLLEDTHETFRILNEIGKSYDFIEVYGKEISFNQIQHDKIIEYINENFTDFCFDFYNYYVGSGCLDSIGFGEQEEQLKGIYNHNTKKDYSLSYLKKVFNEADFYVNGNYAYYDLSDTGIQINIIKGDLTPILKELNLIQ